MLSSRAATTRGARVALSCLPRIALHRIANGLDADGVVWVDGALEEAVIRLCTGQDMDVFWDFGVGMIPEIGLKLGPKFRDSDMGTIPESGLKLYERFERPSLDWYGEMIRLKTGVLAGSCRGWWREAPRVVRVRILGSVPATLFWQARPVVDRTSSPVVVAARARGRHAPC